MRIERTRVTRLRGWFSRFCMIRLARALSARSVGVGYDIGLSGRGVLPWNSPSFFGAFVSFCSKLGWDRANEAVGGRAILLRKFRGKVQAIWFEISNHQRPPRCRNISSPPRRSRKT